MAELKSFPVFGESGKIGTLSAPARFLDHRTEKVIQLEQGGEITVSAASLKVQPDGSFFLLNGSDQNGAKPFIAENVVKEPVAASELSSTVPLIFPSPEKDGVGTARPTVGAKLPAEKLYREGYSIEHVKINRRITEPVSQRQEGDTLILPVVEEVLVTEKHMMLREEIRITKIRDEITDAEPINGASRQIS